MNKIDHSSFSRSGDTIGAHQNLNNSLDMTTPLSETICHPFAMINLPANFEVPISAHCKDIKIDTKCGK